MILKNDKYMLSGCELIDTENISLASQNMKFVGEQADIFQYQWYSHSDDMILSSLFVFSPEKIHDSKYSKYASLKP